MTSDFKQHFIIVITVGVNYDIVDMLWKTLYLVVYNELFNKE